MQIKAMAGAVREVTDKGIVAWVSAETVDRDGDLLLAAGAKLDNYRRNPVVIWAHDYKLPPIGRATDLRVVPGEGVEASTEFADTPFAQEIAGLYRGKFLTAFSVGFIPTASGGPSREGQTGLTITEWELLEYSAVPVPANPDALAKAATDEGSDAAALLLRLYYPEAKDATAAARAAADIRRLKGAAESLRNIYRHDPDNPPFEPADLKAALETVAEVVGSVVEPPAPESHPEPAGELSSDEDVRELMEQVKELSAAVRSHRDQLPATVAAEVKRLRQSYIARR